MVKSWFKRSYLKLSPHLGKLERITYFPPHSMQFLVKYQEATKLNKKSSGQKQRAVTATALSSPPLDWWALLMARQRSATVLAALLWIKGSSCAETQTRTLNKRKIGLWGVPTTYSKKKPNKHSSMCYRETRN